MNYLEINLKDGLIVVNKQPISIFFMNDFIKNLSYINEVQTTEYNEYKTYGFKTIYLENQFNFNIMFQNNINRDKMFSLHWLDCNTNYKAYEATKKDVELDIKKLVKIINTKYNIELKKLNEYNYNFDLGWGILELGGNIKTPNVVISFTYN